MTGSEALALGIAIVAVLLVAGVVQLIGVIHRRRLDERRPDYDELSTRLGFELQQQRWMFDTHVARFIGSRGDLEILLEIDHSERLAYQRVWIEFPVPLDLGFRMMTEAEESIWSRLIRMREVEIGAPSFDPHFLLLARDEERISKLLDEDLRRNLLELVQTTEFIAVDDDAMTLLVGGEIEIEGTSRTIDLAAQAAMRMIRNADAIHDAERNEAEADHVTTAFTPIPGALKAVDSETP